MNAATRAVLAEVLADWGQDLLELIEEWQASAEDFLPTFAEQLRLDLEAGYGSWQDDASGRLITLACRLLLKQVDWLAVARELVAHATLASIPEPLPVGLRTHSPSRAGRMDADLCFSVARSLARVPYMEGGGPLAWPVVTWRGRLPRRR